VEKQTPKAIYKAGSVAAVDGTTQRQFRRFRWNRQACTCNRLHRPGIPWANCALPIT